MLLWFVGTAIIAVWFVFRDPRFDYRLLIVGALLPLLDAVTGHAWVLHTLAFSLFLLLVVMVATMGRRPARKALLAVPIGALLHLVFDGAWTDADLFWWPLGGWSLADDRLPEAARGWWWDIALEVVGLVVLAWVWRRSGLSDRSARRRFRADGRLLTEVR
ncbi:MAG: hypothetical protein ABW328_13255 [Ilumatobacteraceae bacterium]